MNTGLFCKAMREWLPITAAGCAIVIVFEIALAYVMPSFFESELADVIVQIQWLRNIVQTIMGSEITDQLGPQSFLAFPWVHPMLLLTVLAHGIVGCTRVPAGELDRGTIDLLMGLPVSRWQLFMTELVVWILNGAACLAALLAGNLVGNWLVQPGAEMAPGARWIVLANLFVLYLAVGSVAWLVSSLTDRRGVAMAIVFALVLASILFNFLIPYWPWAKQFSFLGLLSYYQPVNVFRTEAWPVKNLVTLGMVGTICWGIAAWVFARRSLCAV